MTGTATAARRRIARDLAVYPTFDPLREIEQRVAYLSDSLHGSGRTRLVLGASGGIDSAVAGRMGQLAVERVRDLGDEASFLAMGLPYGVQRDEPDARTALAFIQPDEVLRVDIQPASDACLDSMHDGGLRLCTM